MPQYLLSTQALLDIAARDGNAAQRWFEEADLRDPPVYSDDIFISAISPAIVNLLIGSMAPSADREALRLSSLALIERFIGRQQVVDITKGIADTWATLVPIRLTYTTAAGRQGDYANSEKLVFATAIAGTEGRPFVLVTSRQPAHAELEKLGLTVEYVSDPHP